MDRITAAAEVGYKPVAWRVRSREEVLQLLTITQRTLDQARVPYFIINGTLLGATKFNGIIPWDDDADVGVLLEHAPRAVQALKAAINDTPYKLSEMLYGYGLHGPNRGILDLVVFDVTPETRAAVDPVYKSCYPLANGQPTFLNSKILPLTLKHSQLYPLRRYKFDHLRLLGPQKGVELCLSKYGADVYQRNARPDHGWGVHPLIPFILPPVTKIVQGVVDLVDRLQPSVFEKFRV